jgi:hypothetical protein
MKEKGDFIALGISIYDSETTLKEVTRGLDHVVSHPFVKWSIKVMDFSSKAREIATVNPRHYEESRQDTVVMRCLKDPHPFFKFIKFHGSTLG